MQLKLSDGEYASESPASIHKVKVKQKKEFRHVVETFVDCACLTIQNFIV